MATTTTPPWQPYEPDDNQSLPPLVLRKKKAAPAPAPAPIVPWQPYDHSEPEPQPTYAPSAPQPPNPEVQKVVSAAPPAPAAPGTAGNPLPGPNPTTGPTYNTDIYKDWWETHKGQFDVPTEAEQYWRGIQGQVQGGPVLPKNAAGAYTTASGLMAGGPKGATNASGVSTELRNTPGTGEEFAGRHIKFFDDPGVGENFGTTALDFFKTPGEAEDYIKKHLGFFETPGMGEEAAGSAIDILSKEGEGSQQIHGMSKDVQDWMKKNPIMDEYNKYFAPGLRDKGYTENLYESGNQGLNQFYQRGLDKQTEKLNREMEARGLYNSGAAVRAIGEAGADATANQAHDMASLAAAADAARLGRSAGALDWSKSGAGDEIARHGIGLDYGKLALEADKYNTDRAKTLSDVGASGQALGEGRVKNGAGLAKDLQGLGEGRMKTGVDIGATVQDLGETRLGRGMSMGTTAQGLKESRLKTSVDAGLAGDKGVEDWASTIMGIGTGADASARADEGEKRDWLDLGGRLAGGVDAGKLSRLNSGGNFAGDVQGSERDKANDEFSQRMQVASAKAKATLDALGGAAGEKFQSAMESLNLMLKQGQLNGENATNLAKELGVDVTSLMKLYELYKGGGA